MLNACAIQETESTKPPKFAFLGLDGRYLTHHHEASSFHPEDVACTDQTTPEQKEKWESLRNNPDGDLFLMAHIDEILAIARKMANQGDPTTMYAFGGLKREVLSIEYSTHVSRTEYKVLPDHEKQDMVIALTYIYISDDIKDLGQRKDHGVLSRLDRGGFKEIPTEWIAEAKENAARWRKHCKLSAN